MTRVGTDQEGTFRVVFLTDNPTSIALALKTAIEAAVGALKTFRLIFPERFAITEMDDEIGRLVAQLNSAFKAYPAA